MEAEPVVDNPEIELFILSAPRQEPVLVEVRFPATFAPRDAKEFILREVQEVACDARGPAFLRLPAAGGLTVQTGELPPSSWADQERVSLDEGGVSGLGWAPVANLTASPHRLVPLDTVLDDEDFSAESLRLDAHLGEDWRRTETQ